jgi:methyltransferase (TIGR00027 family)
MPRNPAAQTAFGPMLLVAVEQGEPPGRRLVDDDLAVRFLPAPMRWLVNAAPSNPLQRLTIAAMEREGPGLFAALVCRKRYIADTVTAALDDVDAVVVLGAGLDTLAYRLARTTDVPVFEVDLPVNVARKTAAVHRALGTQPHSVRLVPLDFEHDDVMTTLAQHGYRPDGRTLFVWEAVTQYLSPEAVHATLSTLRSAPTGSRLVFTYVRRDFIDGVNLYGAEALYRRFVQRQRLWHFGLPPHEAAPFLAGHGWQLSEQAGPDLIMQRYVEPTGRPLTVSPIEWSAYAEKTS